MPDQSEAPASPTPELVHLDVRAHVATVTLDSPRNRNALSSRLVAELQDRLATADADSAVRVVVLAHTGGTFCAGADLAEAVSEGMEARTRALLALLRAVVSMATPVVAVVRGHARAGGIGLIGACDIALTTPESSFGFAEVKLGLTPAIISLTTRSLLADRVASRLYLTGEVFDGSAAARYGLVSDCVPDEAIEAEVDRVCGQFANVSPQGLRETKSLLSAPVLAAMDRDGERLVALSARLFASDEAREAMTAFREHRPPRWALPEPGGTEPEH